MKTNHFKFMPKYVTYNYLKELHSKGKRIVVSRYGDGEYFIIIGKKGNKGRIAKQTVSDEMIRLLNYSVQVKGQLICLPAKIKIDSTNVNESKNIKFSDLLSRHIIKITNHSLYGQGQWRMIDLLKNNSDLITNFFLGKTLIVTGHKEAADYAFKKMSDITVYETPVFNACNEYKSISKDLISSCKEFKNIVVACGPLSKMLIGDLITQCNSNLIDLGSVVGIIINPFSSGNDVVRKWSGFGKKGKKEVVERCSVEFFKTLNMKLGKK